MLLRRKVMSIESDRAMAEVGCGRPCTNASSPKESPTPSTLRHGKAAVLEVLSEYSLHTAAKAGITERVRALIEGGGSVGMPLTPS